MLVKMLTKSFSFGYVLLIIGISIARSSAEDGGWGEWSDTVECSAQCGGGTKQRSRSCNNPAPTDGGALCRKTDSTEGETESEEIGCNSQQCDFDKWGDEWTPAACIDCAIVEQSRDGFCGEDTLCLEENGEPLKQRRLCYKWRKDNCSSPCQSATCPDGTYCSDKSTNDKPMFECICNATGFEYDAVKEECFDPNVDMDGEWDDWLEEQKCTATCEPETTGTVKGKKKKKRNCSKPKPQAKGKHCKREDESEGLTEIKEEECSIDCDNDVIDGEWGEYKEVGDCTKPCNRGKQLWERKCSSPVPRNNGKLCNLTLRDRTSKLLMTDQKVLPCNTQTCPFEDKWENWSACPECTISTITRNPLCGDEVCPSEVKKPETKPCNTWINNENCEDPCASNPCPDEATCKNTSTLTEPKYECECPDGKTLSARGTKCNGPDDVDGGWTPPAPFKDECEEMCEGGKKVEVRSCNRPAPKNNGELCVDDDGKPYGDSELWFINTTCPERTCHDGKWTPWTPCDECVYGDDITTESSPLCGDFICPPEDKMAPQKKVEVCDTWRKETCPGPCITGDYECPEKSTCKDNSTATRPGYYCFCNFGLQMNKDKTECIIPPPVPPTPRPIPVLPEEQKTVATVISKTASTVLIVMVTITLVLFLILRIFTPDRVIQMNMEISLLLAHVCLMLPPSTSDKETLCRTISILIHFFFTACYTFMMLEALHMYSLVAFVVKKDGLFSRLQNILIGWGIALIIVLFNICFEYNNYGGEYHCWLQMNTPLFYGQLIPIAIIVIITITLIEAAGSAEYKPLMGVDTKQRTSAKISQRTNLILLPFMIAHWFLGMLSEYEQNLPLYGTFSVVNAIFGVLVFFFHCSNNQQVRDKLGSCFKSIRGKKTTASQ